MGLKTFHRRRRLLQQVMTHRCNVCQSKNFARFQAPLEPPAGYHYFKCGDCQLIFVLCDSNFAPEEFYAESTIPDLGEGEEEWNRHYLESIEALLPEKGKLLELGFGNASFSLMAHQTGWETHGVELSEPLVNHARDTLGLPNITLGYLEEVGYPAEAFDVVAGFNFLEHVPDPHAILTEISRILRPGGLVAVMVPNIDGLYHRLMTDLLGRRDPLNISWVPPSHIFYFNKDNLTTLFRRSGFEVAADESQRMMCLWRQHEHNFGPEVTQQRLDALLQEVQASGAPAGSVRLSEYYDRISQLVAQRMTWTLVESILQLEVPLGMESCLLFVGRKVEPPPA